LIEKARCKRKAFDGDRDFYKDSEDTGMCISMHQPWASLLVYGFKRFEGREWSTKYRGPLWIHATSQKPKAEEIEAMEKECRRHYESIGEDMPAFPARYFTSSVIGRVDLIDVISLEEYHDTVPEPLRETTTSAF
jgi:activating signal cointegrator 1